ncbi:unnamed protein product [Cuscuta campestris]|uniref:RING-type domain-containing protein n=2 Tax=Cuscuta sect. Cleistogrammica TaxID=1824901 RepID=A0A484L806_9ASTE|nr:hypothetical protein DM860_005722 [Cuscuta australis]VFQ72479.1 unnamed protein product [Cuscuta campestris]
MCSSFSWGIVHPRERGLLFVNAGPGDPLDYLMELKPRGFSAREGILSWIYDYSEALFKTMTAVDDGRRPYRMCRLVFTVNEEDGSVVRASYLHYNSQGQVLDFVDDEYDSNAARSMAESLLRWEGIMNDLPPKALLLEEESDDGICVICHEEYGAGDMIGAVHCKHMFHDKCIRQWLRTEFRCPLCRTRVLGIIFQKHR